MDLRERGEYKEYNECRLCPRACGVNRNDGQHGMCGMDAVLYAARAALHCWEEPCLSGKSGSGTVFFTGCALRCVYCQNYAISGRPVSGRDTKRINDKGSLYSADLPAGDTAGYPAGTATDASRLAEIFFELKEKGAVNINLVTASHYIPHVAHAIEKAKAQGFDLPFVYNSSGYESAEGLKHLDGLIDIYLPDFKYMRKDTARMYSYAPDYPEAAKAAVGEMVRQVPRCAFEESMSAIRERPGADRSEICRSAGRSEVSEGKKMPAVRERSEASLMKKGVIVRHLVLPGHVKEAKSILTYLYETYGDRIYFSIMNQYTPMPSVQNDTLLKRRVTKREYESVLSHAIALGIANAFYQDGGTAKESFIPSFNGEGIIPAGNSGPEP